MLNEPKKKPAAKKKPTEAKGDAKQASAEKPSVKSEGNKISINVQQPQAEPATRKRDVKAAEKGLLPAAA